MELGTIQEHLMNIMFIAVLVVIGGTFAFDVLKKRRRMKIAQADGANLETTLNTELPAGFVVLKDVYLNTKLGRSRADYVMVSPYGIFALEYRHYYIHIRADEQTMRWTYAPGIKGKPFVSPLYQSKVHLHCIKELIGKPNVNTYPMIVFPSIAEIELKNPSEESFVGLPFGVLPFIQSCCVEKCLSAEEVAFIAEKLEENSEAVREGEQPEPAKETPEEYKAFIPGEFRTESVDAEGEDE